MRLNHLWRLVVAGMCALTVLPVGASSASQEAGSAESPVKQFARQVDREWPGESQQQDITVDSLRHLMRAIESLLPTGPDDSTTRFERSRRQLVDAIAAYREGIPGEIGQAKRLRKVFLEASDLIAAMARDLARVESRNPRVSALRRSARSLDDDQRLLRQPDVIERFFDHAAAVLLSIEAVRTSSI